ncbi:MAG: hypothetical protein U9Q92_04050 [archaeon]|nr:hypothetical protein [archaeon]
MGKTKYVIFAAIVLACLAPAALAANGIVTERSFNDNVAAGETFEVMLSVDISEENKPTMYILTENVPVGFEVVDTDAKVNDNVTGVMKWVAIDGLLGGRVEDTVYVYHLRAPDTAGEYEVIGNVLLKDESRHETVGRTLISVREAQTISDSISSPKVILSAIVILIIISAAALYSRKKAAKAPKAGHVRK